MSAPRPLRRSKSFYKKNQIEQAIVDGLTLKKISIGSMKKDDIAKLSQIEKDILAPI